MEAALKAAGKAAEFILYLGAPHAFNADYRQVVGSSRRPGTHPPRSIALRKRLMALALSAGLGSSRIPYRAARKSATRSWH
jgi:dienelactone hydrolase